MSKESSMQINPKSELNPESSANAGLQRILTHLTQKMERDQLVQEVTHDLRQLFQVDRVVLYYFYRQWKGQVTFESSSAKEFSILGSTGPDDCFNGDYAAMYLAGRVRAIANIETEEIAPCHRDFLRDMSVYANLVVPVLTQKGLWGLLVAHHCRSPRIWKPNDITAMQTSAERLATAPSIQES
jgi:GAF domain-containing protein